jgi:hypothetical protein
MRCKSMLAAAGAAFFAFGPLSAFCGTDAPSSASGISPQSLAKVVPDRSTKAEIKTLFGAPWRVVQFNDCGEAMEDQADETWEYRGSDASGTFRLHIEFNDHGKVHLVAKIPDQSLGGKGTAAKVAPPASSSGMSM